jgi:hypothetical protein
VVVLTKVKLWHRLESGFGWVAWGHGTGSCYALEAGVGGVIMHGMGWVES